MARQELGPHSLRVAQRVAEMLDGVEAAVVGCSGGPDSLALALGAEWAGRRTGTRITAVIVDHRLQSGSDRVAAETAELLAWRGIDAVIRRVDVRDTGEGPESAARSARRAALLEVAQGRPVLLGHTLDDQAETVLLGLARGSGVTSLAGIRPRAGSFWHPLLEIRRTTTVAACREWGVRPWHDPQNADPVFRRSLVRRSTLPVLEQDLGPGVAEALARTAVLMQGEDAVMADLADAWLARHAVLPQDLAGDQSLPALPLPTLPLPDLVSEPRGLARRVVKAWLQRAGVESSFVHVEAVLDLQHARGGAGVDLPGARVTRRGRRLELNRGDENSS
ncbi:tRNA lysidine(34) synthetase TilS [Acidipropionibacterium jensenii]|uniref:tRNA lysidine(34) synthetase TilS n=1 Tax=Acidipropionibacterium jensenii TaxID=1749 RepID=UPI002649E4B0|nr:tRNA lysidine(34) synthetase TilS [Acidipropionibacterium jensenii]MDN5996803.1 tRNA lysidine(34) synthetase TilS [Acidipropionibacterium jensenii]